jgi:DNA-directed RNA polymerase beta' subunit
VAELTNLEEKLAEVIGLAQAAQQATEKVINLEEADEVSDVLKRMNAEAAETERRGTSLVEQMEGKKTAILEKARETKSKASDMLSTYIDEEADALDGFEFLTMAEAGEVGHWKVLRQMAESAGRQEIMDLIEWALPIQERHFAEAQATSLKLAADEDPNEAG